MVVTKVMDVREEHYDPEPNSRYMGKIRVKGVPMSKRG